MVKEQDEQPLRAGASLNGRKRAEVSFRIAARCSVLLRSRGDYLPVTGLGTHCEQRQRRRRHACLMSYCFLDVASLG